MTPRGRLAVRQFKWIDWNLRKIDAHGLSPEEVEAAFRRIYAVRARQDGSFEMSAETPSGRRIWVIWRFDREYDESIDALGESEEAPIFVIAAY
jgi:hypothetical protein